MCVCVCVMDLPFFFLSFFSFFSNSYALDTVQDWGGKAGVRCRIKGIMSTQEFNVRGYISLL